MGARSKTPKDQPPLHGTFHGGVRKPVTPNSEINIHVKVNEIGWPIPTFVQIGDANRTRSAKTDLYKFAYKSYGISSSKVCKYKFDPTPTEARYMSNVGPYPAPPTMVGRRRGKFSDLKA